MSPHGTGQTSMIKRTKDKVPMRVLACLLAVIPAANATIAPDDSENPTSVTIQFQSGSATFSLLNERVKTIDFAVENKHYSTELTECVPLEHVLFDTAKLFQRKNGTFTLTFQMGVEKDRQYGKLPLVQILYQNGRLKGRYLTRQTDEHSASSSSLCQR
jgi:hypothetical protein